MAQQPTHISLFIPHSQATPCIHTGLERLNQSLLTGTGTVGEVPSDSILAKGCHHSQELEESSRNAGWPVGRQ